MSYGGFSVFWGRCPGCRSLLVLAVVSTYGCVRRLLVLAILSTYVYTVNCIKLRLFQSVGSYQHSKKGNRPRERLHQITFLFSNPIS